MPQGPVTARRVAVVVPTWNGRRWIDRCLGSLRATAYPLSAIFVVDNGSRDGTAEAVASRFPQVALIAGIEGSRRQPTWASARLSSAGLSSSWS